MARVFRSLSVAAACAFVSVLGTACANPPAARAGDHQNDGSAAFFNAALGAAQSGNVEALYAYQSQMQGGLFAMYPSYWLLNRDLKRQSADAVVDFARRYQGSVMAEKLVADFAEEKALQGDYAAVRQAAPWIANADNSEACAIALGFNASSTEAYRALEQKRVWLNTDFHIKAIASLSEMPPLCHKLASEMANNPYINNTDRHERLLRMLRVDNRRLSGRADDTRDRIVQLARQLGLGIDYGDLNAIRQNPRAFLNGFGNRTLAARDQYLYVYAISQLAHRSYNEAIGQLESDIRQDDARAQKRIDDWARRYAYRAIAVKRMNMNTTDGGFDRRVLRWFAASLGEPFNFEEAEDYAQAAIYFGQWQDVQRAIALMDVRAQKDRVWRYWQARSLEALGQKGQAQAIYRQLSDGVDYYGLLAKDRLGQRLKAEDLDKGFVAQDAQSVWRDAHFARALLLIQNGADSAYVDREWNWAVRKAREAGNTALIANAAAIAYDLGKYKLAISAIDNSGAKNATAGYPLLFSNGIHQNARGQNIDPAWIYGVIRQESRFEPVARSDKGAQGLMQIMPRTAEEIARKNGYRSGDMNDPDANVRFGARYLADLLAQSGGQTAVATAGYNAGPNAARAWLPKQAAIDADRYVEAIPYVETRPYVKYVMANATVYGVLLGNPISISQRMGKVEPR